MTKRHERGMDNLVIKTIRHKLSAMQSTADELKTNKQMIETLRDSSTDERVRMNAAKLLHDTEIRIAEIEYKMYEHDNPAVSRQEITHKGLPTPPTTLTVVIADNPNAAR